MGKFYYAKMADTAARLLDRFGSAITINRTIGESIHPVTGVVTPGSVTTFTPNGVLTKFPDELIDGTRILRSDRKLILDDTVAPLVTDKPVIQGEEWSVQEVMTVEPAGTPIVYECIVRK